MMMHSITQELTKEVSRISEEIIWDGKKNMKRLRLNFNFNE